MGDGVLLAFSAADAQAAVVALRSAQDDVTRLWQAFDVRCRVAVRVSAGNVLVGTFGPPGDERPDIFGDALNQLYKSPSGSFVLTPQIEALLR
jgi:class 3 adenylate cyclase